MTNQDYLLQFTLASDAIFGSAERSTPLIDIDVQHDQWGCPYLPGRTLKGVLREECANILFALEKMGKEDGYIPAARKLFGVRGGGADEEPVLRFRNACLPAADRQVLVNAVKSGAISSREVLDALTTPRSQTSIDELTGSAKPKSLRTLRTILRETTFKAPIHFIKKPEDKELELLCACMKGLRRLGSSRNRGLGELKDVLFWDETYKEDFFINTFKNFESKLTGGIQ